MLAVFEVLIIILAQVPNASNSRLSASIDVHLTESNLPADFASWRTNALKTLAEADQLLREHIIRAAPQEAVSASASARSGAATEEEIGGRDSDSSKDSLEGFGNNASSALRPPIQTESPALGVIQRAASNARYGQVIPSENVRFEISTPPSVAEPYEARSIPIEAENEQITNPQNIRRSSSVDSGVVEARVQGHTNVQDFSQNLNVSSSSIGAQGISRRTLPEDDDTVLIGSASNTPPTFEFHNSEGKDAIEPDLRSNQEPLRAPSNSAFAASGRAVETLTGRYVNVC